MSAPAPRPELPTLPVTFRPTRTRVVLLSVGAVMFLVITAVALTLEQLSPGERASFVFTALLFFGVLALLSRPKVVANEDGVTVVNLTRTRRLSWAEILRVNLRVGDPWVFLDLSDGTSMPALGIQPGIAKQQAIRDARTLRALAERHGTGTDIG
ncbi:MULTISPECIES: PH domain-containing protein [unclassified Streptomyces]|uniref:PH domain-containing protein n=1 Tax=unclassified Streptomyces TaxID=2593676 RepID=UPI000F5BC261|nr:MULTISPECIES: PH domain-containing protein [unclassified Streptomyces]WSG49613.1 PH domain-containing protein [Streptomyces sp. NBC_01732]WSX00265.1 PH domain-containing protein [Streptomyces sp. NBC_00987]MCX4397942.1 PH domain-containing protein [Streptomyces sp. NBC_01767]MCX5099360.1 PH domain-containing protein [Streptomyces sp. NBC_00439]MCX5158906.1 PH domain-containing protein [Streptomyces sp. NBC_00305]